MNYKFIPNTVKNLFLNPGRAWEIINSENISTSDLRNGFLIPLVVLVSISAYGGSILFVNSELSGVYSVLTALKCFIVTFFSIYSTALLLTVITKRLELSGNDFISFQLVVFSSVPFLACQILSQLFESFLFINILAFSGLYIFWVGAEKLLNPPQQKKMPLLFAATVTLILVYVLTEIVLSKIIDKVYYSIFA